MRVERLQEIEWEDPVAERIRDSRRGEWIRTKAASRRTASYGITSMPRAAMAGTRTPGFGQSNSGKHYHQAAVTENIFPPF